MSYASVADMVARFGETEMIRLSQPEDRTAETVLAAKVELALADATGLIDDYLRARYAVPLASIPDSVVRAACVLARYDLAKGERTEPTEQMRLDRKEVISWLQGIAGGDVNIAAPVAASASDGSSGARASDRPAIFDDRELRHW